MENLKEKQPVVNAPLVDIRTDELGRLFDKYHQGIYAYCVHRLFCRTAAEDVTSQVFLSVAQNFHLFRGQTENAVFNWLYTIAVNQCNTYLRTIHRHRKALEQLSLSAQEHVEESLQPDKPDWKQVYEAILRLSQTEQTVITLRFFEHLSYEQIAAIVSKRQAAVRTLTFRGLKKLRKMLNTAWGGYDK
jgi:RNA polymerase sigma factor (sigma-70 family)